MGIQNKSTSADEIKKGTLFRKMLGIVFIVLVSCTIGAILSGVIANHRLTGVINRQMDASFNEVFFKISGIFDRFEVAATENVRKTSGLFSLEKVWGLFLDGQKQYADDAKVVIEDRVREALTGHDPDKTIRQISADLDALSVKINDDVKARSGEYVRDSMGEIGKVNVTLVMSQEGAQREIGDIHNRATESIKKSFLENQRVSLVVLFLSMILIAFIVSVVAFLMARSIVRPISMMARYFNEMARGDQPRPIQMAVSGEMRQLLDSFNRMTENLQLVTASRDELNREVAERLAAEERLAAAYKQLKDTQAQLVQSEKMASIGVLSAGVAHEINNPLAFVMGNLSILQTYLDDYHAVLRAAEDLIKAFDSYSKEEALKQIDQFHEFERSKQIEVIINDTVPLLEHTLMGLKRVQKIVLDLKTFARADSNIMLESDINKLLDDAIRILGNQFQGKVDLIREYGQMPLVMCREQSLQQVFLNLLLNAAQSIEGHGTIRVLTSVHKDMARIEIIDTGKGIAVENLNKVFDPFFTTKPVGKGTGLGLSVSYDIIKQHRGEILVESELGKGTKFTVSLPLKGITDFPVKV